MSKPETIQDLRSAGLVTLRDVDRMAHRIFSNLSEMHGVIDGYVVHAPEFSGLPETCQQFIRKALGFATVQNILDVETDPPVMDTEDEGSHYANVSHDGDA